MDLGNQIIHLCKEKTISRDNLSKLVGTSGAIIGRYEINEITPYIEVTTKMAIEVSLDYLVSPSSEVIKDKKMVCHLESDPLLI